jgi:DNA repair protein RecO (recombination protein O)
MDEPAQGIVLRYHPFSETSLIVRWLTRDHGRIDTIARGALRPKSPLRGRLDLFYLAEFTFARNRRSELHSLHDLRLLDTYAPLRADLARLRLASYASALVTQTTEIGPPLPEIFSLLHGFLQHLASHSAKPLLSIAFEMKLLAALGHEPGPDELRLSLTARTIVRECRSADWQQLPDPPSDAVRAMDASLHRFLEFNFGRTLALRPGATNRS